jgi:hypothetical protein
MESLEVEGMTANESKHSLVLMGGTAVKKIKIRTQHHKTEVDQERQEKGHFRLKTQSVSQHPLQLSHANRSEHAPSSHKKTKKSVYCELDP